MAKTKDWDDMTPDEKADSLRKRLEHVVDQINDALAQITRRVSAIEANLKKSHKGS